MDGLLVSAGRGRLRELLWPAVGRGRLARLAGRVGPAELWVRVARRRAGLAEPGLARLGAALCGVLVLLGSAGVRLALAW